MMENEYLPTLKNPTVADLVLAFADLPQNTPLVIRDADTGWTINTIHLEIYNDQVVLYGEYYEMNE